MLIEPTEALREAYAEFVEEFRRAGEHYHQDERREVRRDFAGFIRRLRDAAAGIGLPEGYVPSTCYWLVRGGRVIGTIRLRHRLTPRLARFGGHVGYDVRPSERRRGHGKRMLALVLDKARALGLKRLLVTCGAVNVASAGVIRHNGGTLDSVGPSPEDGKLLERYWIDL